MNKQEYDQLTPLQRYELRLIHLSANADGERPDGWSIIFSIIKKLIREGR